MTARDLAALDMRALNDDHNGSRTGDYPRDVLKLLKHIREQDETIAKLRGILRQQCEHSEYCYGCERHTTTDDGHAAGCIVLFEGTNG